MNKGIVVMVVLIGILIISIVQGIEINSMKGKTISGNAVAGDSGKLDTAGWTENEKMNYDMHGTIPARLQGKASASSGTDMVGGC